MILVTGGCGYIGSHLVKTLSERGEKVIVLDSLVHGRREALLYNEELHIGDITDMQWLDSNLQNQDIDTIIHCAALVNAAESVEQADVYANVNYEGTKNVLALAASSGVKNFLFASSAAVYGNPGTTTPISEKGVLTPTNPYGQSKLDAEEAIMATGLKYGIFRFFNVGGADKSGVLFQSRENNAIITRLLMAAKTNKPLIISGADYPTIDGSVVRDFIHVDDVVSGIVAGLAYLRTNNASYTVNLGSGTTTSMKELVKIAQQITGSKITINFGPRKTGDIIYSCADITKAHDLLGWSPKHTIQDIVSSAWRAMNAF
jgi:UDP-glucose 4-epimerase